MKHSANHGLGQYCLYYSLRNIGPLRYFMEEKRICRQIPLGNTTHYPVAMFTSIIKALRSSAVNKLFQLYLTQCFPRLSNHGNFFHVTSINILQNQCVSMCFGETVLEISVFSDSVWNYFLLNSFEPLL